VLDKYPDFLKSHSRSSNPMKFDRVTVRHKNSHPTYTCGCCWMLIYNYG
jgi:hypothetical protein